MSSFNWPPGGSGGGIPILNSNPVNPTVPSAWFLWTQPHAWTETSGSISSDPSQGLTSIVDGSVGALDINFSSLTGPDQTYLESIGFNSSGSVTFRLATDTGASAGVNAAGSGGTTTLTVGGTLPATFFDLIAALNAWAVANLHAGIGTVFSASDPTDLSKPILDAGLANNPLASDFVTETVSLVFQGENDTYSVSLGDN